MLDIYRLILRRKPFKGQFRLFAWLYNHKKLKQKSQVVSPIFGSFKVYTNTKNYIDANIYYLGDYEPWLKKHFKTLITKGANILDVGANIGFHSLYFAELAGAKGHVISVEPIPQNFEALEKNIALNSFSNITTVQKALASEERLIEIGIDINNQNPGAFSLFNNGEKKLKIACTTGDMLLNKLGIRKIDFIKIDVEGFELEVLKGLSKTIEKDRPVIVFEFDRNYQLRKDEVPNEIFLMLSSYNYVFEAVDGYGKKRPFVYSDQILSAEIIARVKS